MSNSTVLPTILVTVTASRTGSAVTLELLALGYVVRGV